LAGAVASAFAAGAAAAGAGTAFASVAAGAATGFGVCAEASVGNIANPHTKTNFFKIFITLTLYILSGGAA
jgi:F0F1-type ATP synthase membrane subunit c/vacuolar-type H+-ATPase subunit K